MKNLVKSAKKLTDNGWSICKKCKGNGKKSKSEDLCSNCGGEGIVPHKNIKKEDLKAIEDLLSDDEE